MPEGKDGELYIRNYSLTYFDLVVIVMAERETSFASILYHQLIAKGKLFSLETSQTPNKIKKGELKVCNAYFLFNLV